MERPEITIELTPFNYFLEALTVVGAASVVFVPLYYYPDRPEKIPSHFDGRGYFLVRSFSK